MYIPGLKFFLSFIALWRMSIFQMLLHIIFTHVIKMALAYLMDFCLQTLFVLFCINLFLNKHEGCTCILGNIGPLVHASMDQAQEVP